MSVMMSGQFRRESDMPSDTPGIDSSDFKKRLQELLVLVQKEDLREAVYACDSFNRDYPVSGQGWSIASQLALRINNAEAATRAIEHALGIDPERPEWLLQKANCLPLVGRMDEARVIAGEMSKRLYPSAQISSAVGLLLSRLNMHEESMVLFRDAIKQEPGTGGHYYNLATSQRYLGDLKNAESSLDKAIELDPGNVDAMVMRSGLRKQTTADNHVAELKQSLDGQSSSPQAAVNICYAIAKELEDLEDYEETFKFLSRGASLRRQHINYDVQEDLDVMAQIQATFDGTRLDNNRAGHIDAGPIFVIGMPRTGTTLVERILRSHSVVMAGGELKYFAQEMTDFVRTSFTSPISTRTEFVAAAAEIDFAALGGSYIDCARPMAGEHAHFVDKMPLNFLYAGLIHLALPKARIINLLRDPMDACFAVFKTLFEGAYPYSYNLEELARYYVAYNRLMMHWEKVMPGVMLHVEYENLVADAENQIHALLEHCDLSREQQCLEFGKQNQASTTASAVQDRQQLYQSAVGEWRHYRDELQPVAAILRRAGIEIADR